MNSNDQSDRQSGGKVQGEGDYEAARRYDQSARDFAQSGKVKPAADQSAPRDEREAESAPLRTVPPSERRPLAPLVMTAPAK